MPFQSEAQRRFMWARHPKIAERWSKKYGGTVPANKRGQKGSTGAGRGFSTHSQAGGSKSTEDTPGWDPRTQGNRRYGRGATLPGGGRAKRRHGAPYHPGQSSQAGTTSYRKAIARRLGLPKGKASDVQDRRKGK